MLICITPKTWEEKIKSAVDSKCIRFDSAIGGLGGCPMAKDELTGNMATENVVSFFNKNKIRHNLDQHALNQSIVKATSFLVHIGRLNSIGINVQHSYI